MCIIIHRFVSFYIYIYIYIYIDIYIYIYIHISYIYMYTAIAITSIFTLIRVAVKVAMAMVLANWNYIELIKNSYINNNSLGWIPWTSPSVLQQLASRSGQAHENHDPAQITCFSINLHKCMLNWCDVDLIFMQFILNKFWCLNDFKLILINTFKEHIKLTLHGFITKCKSPSSASGGQPGNRRLGKSPFAFFRDGPNMWGLCHGQSRVWCSACMQATQFLIALCQTFVSHQSSSTMQIHMLRTPSCNTALCITSLCSSTLCAWICTGSL